MGTITVNVQDEVEKKFREVAGSIYGRRKGHLGRALTEAMKIWIKKKEETHVIKALHLLEKGFKMGKITYKKREELHRR